MFGLSKQHTGNYTVGILLFAGLCLIALIGLRLVKPPWPTAWGATAAAPI